MKVFYIRCSTEEQNEERQTINAKEVNAEKIFIDKASGKNTERKAFKEMMSFIRNGDTLICSDISRIARNTKDLLNIIEELNNRGIEFISLKESIDTTTPQGKFMLTVFGAMAELERMSILQRQKEGIAIAKAKGKYKGRQKIKLDEEKLKVLCGEWREGKRTAVSIQRELNITSQTFYRRVKELNI